MFDFSGLQRTKKSREDLEDILALPTLHKGKSEGENSSIWWIKARHNHGAI